MIKTQKLNQLKAYLVILLKKIPPESYKKSKVDYDQSNDINISEIDYDSDDGEFTGWNK